MCDLYPEGYKRIQAEIDEMIGNFEYTLPEERSRDRLLRIRKGMIHVLCEVLPPIDDPKKQELYYWLERMTTIIGIEEVEAKTDTEANHV
ncbi:TPA: hypothetical protein U2M19_000852 [Providencia rettgeri]|uniref:hypothetical protein n=1 Tax=Providencia rettgeri TaxID=587 RepID=UPI0018C4AC5B|nr:hypothetical protein [Providencia rettgeri]MBG5922564.1 hypothetical protein [Providencia rettgeri]HEM8210042.1 hypothetical protein [Providencia rettgeri]